MQRRTSICAFALLLLLAPAPPAPALERSELYGLLSSYFNPDPNAGLTAFRSLLIPVGGLAEGMGQAYTAVARDSSYLESNPAASSGLERTEFAVFHNNWIADTRIESAVYTVRDGALGLGVGGKWLYLPFTSYDDYGDRAGSGFYSEAVAAFNLSYNFLAGYYFHGLALGATAKLAYRSVPADIEEAAGNSALGAMVDLGVLTRFNFLKAYSSRQKNSSIGLALKNLGPPVLGEPLPTLASLGLAYSPIRPLTLSFDLSKPLNLLDPGSSERLSYASGFSIAMTDFFGLQGGFLLKGGNPRISLGSSFAVELFRVTVNYTLDLTTQFTPLNRISVQASLDLGDLGRAELAKKVDSLYLTGLEAFAAGDTAAAAAAWTECLRLDPGFDPARENLAAAKASLELLGNIEELERLER